MRHIQLPLPSSTFTHQNLCKQSNERPILSEFRLTDDERNTVNELKLPPDTTVLDFSQNRQLLLVFHSGKILSVVQLKLHNPVQPSNPTRTTRFFKSSTEDELLVGQSSQGSTSHDHRWSYALSPGSSLPRRITSRILKLSRPSLNEKIYERNLCTEWGNEECIIVDIEYAVLIASNLVIKAFVVFPDGKGLFLWNMKQGNCEVLKYQLGCNFSPAGSVHNCDLIITEDDLFIPVYHDLDEQRLLTSVMLHSGASTADLVCQVNSLDRCSVSLEALQASLQSRQLDTVAFFLKTWQETLALTLSSPESAVTLTHAPDSEGPSTSATRDTSPSASENLLAAVRLLQSHCRTLLGDESNQWRQLADQLLHMTNDFLVRVAETGRQSMNRGHEVTSLARGSTLDRLHEHGRELREIMRPPARQISSRSSRVDGREMRPRRSTGDAANVAMKPMIEEWRTMTREGVLLNSLQRGELCLANQFADLYLGRMFTREEVEQATRQQVLRWLEEGQWQRATHLLACSGSTPEKSLSQLCSYTDNVSLRERLSSEFLKNQTNSGLSEESKSKLEHLETAYTCRDPATAHKSRVAVSGGKSTTSGLPLSKRLRDRSKRMDTQSRRQLDLIVSTARRTRQQSKVERDDQEGLVQEDDDYALAWGHERKDTEGGAQSLVMYARFRLVWMQYLEEETVQRMLMEAMSPCLATKMGCQRFYSSWKQSPDLLCRFLLDHLLVDPLLDMIDLEIDTDLSPTNPPPLLQSLTREMKRCMAGDRRLLLPDILLQKLFRELIRRDAGFAYVIDALDMGVEEVYCRLRDAGMLYLAGAGGEEDSSGRELRRIFERCPTISAQVEEMLLKAICSQNSALALWAFFDFSQSLSRERILSISGDGEDLVHLVMEFRAAEDTQDSASILAACMHTFAYANKGSDVWKQLKDPQDLDTLIGCLLIAQVDIDKVLSTDSCEVQLPNVAVERLREAVNQGLCTKSSYDLKGNEETDLIGCGTYHLSLYDLLASCKLFDLSRMFTWQAGNRCARPERESSGQETKTDNARKCGVLPSFKDPSPAVGDNFQLSSCRADLNFTYYLGQGRPVHAFLALIAELIGQGYRSTIPCAVIHQIAFWTHHFALGHLSNERVLSGCLAFQRLIAWDPRLLRCHLATAYWLRDYRLAVRVGERCGQSSTPCKRIVEEINQNLGELLRDCMMKKGREKRLTRECVLRELEDSFLWRIREGKIEKMESIIESWLLLPVFADLHGIRSLPDGILTYFAAKNDWLLFLCFAEAFAFSKRQLKQVVHEFTTPSLRDHLTYVVEKAQLGTRYRPRNASFTDTEKGVRRGGSIRIKREPIPTTVIDSTQVTTPANSTVGSVNRSQLMTRLMGRVAPQPPPSSSASQQGTISVSKTAQLAAAASSANQNSEEHGLKPPGGNVYQSGGASAGSGTERQSIREEEEDTRTTVSSGEDALVSETSFPDTNLRRGSNTSVESFQGNGGVSLSQLAKSAPDKLFDLLFVCAQQPCTSRKNSTDAQPAEPGSTPDHSSNETQREEDEEIVLLPRRLLAYSLALHHPLLAVLAKCCTSREHTREDVTTTDVSEPLAYLCCFVVASLPISFAQNIYSEWEDLAKLDWTGNEAEDLMQLIVREHACSVGADAFQIFMKMSPLGPFFNVLRYTVDEWNPVEREKHIIALAEACQAWEHLLYNEPLRLGDDFEVVAEWTNGVLDSCFTLALEEILRTRSARLLDHFLTDWSGGLKARPGVHRFLTVRSTELILLKDVLSIILALTEAHPDIVVDHNTFSVRTSHSQFTDHCRQLVTRICQCSGPLNGTLSANLSRLVTLMPALQTSLPSGARERPKLIIPSGSEETGASDFVNPFEGGVIPEEEMSAFLTSVFAGQNDAKMADLLSRDRTSSETSSTWSTQNWRQLVLPGPETARVPMTSTVDTPAAEERKIRSFLNEEKLLEAFHYVGRKNVYSEDLAILVCCMQLCSKKIRHEDLPLHLRKLLDPGRSVEVQRPQIPVLAGAASRLRRSSTQFGLNRVESSLGLARQFGSTAGLLNAGVVSNKGSILSTLDRLMGFMKYGKSISDRIYTLAYVAEKMSEPYELVVKGKEMDVLTKILAGTSTDKKTTADMYLGAIDVDTEQLTEYLTCICAHVVRSECCSQLPMGYSSHLPSTSTPVGSVGTPQHHYLTHSPSKQPTRPAGPLVTSLSKTDGPSEEIHRYALTVARRVWNRTVCSTEAAAALGKLESGGLQVSDVMLLAHNPCRLGQAFLETVESCRAQEMDDVTNRADAEFIVEMLILAHNSYTQAGSTEGISHCLKMAREVTSMLSAGEHYTLMTRLLSGIARFSEMTYVFDQLIETHQFELLLRKDVDKDGKLVPAILEYLHRYHHDDLDMPELVCAKYALHRELAETKEAKGERAIRRLKKAIRAGADEVSLREVCREGVQHFVDAALSYNKKSCSQHAISCYRRAQLLSVQLNWLHVPSTGSSSGLFGLGSGAGQTGSGDLPGTGLPGGVLLINLKKDEAILWLKANPKFYEAYVFVNYLRLQETAWPVLLCEHVLIRGDMKYLQKYLDYHNNLLTTAVLQECIRSFRIHPNRSSKLLINLRQVLKFSDDVTVVQKLRDEFDIPENE